MEEFDTKNIYLKKKGSIVGLHSIGHKGPYAVSIENIDGDITKRELDFQAIESWGNEYEEDCKTIKGRGSFRVFDLCIEDTALAFEEDGYVRFNPELKRHEALDSFIQATDGQQARNLKNI